MLRSMTGFGSVEAEAGDASVAVEARSVNARHLQVRTSLSPGGDAWEGLVRERVTDRIDRGRVEVSVEVETPDAGAAVRELDRGRVEALLKAFRTLREEYGLEGPIDLSLLARAGDLLRTSPEALADRVEASAVEAAVDRAVEALVEMREREGEQLAEDLRGRLAALRSGLERVEELAPRRLDRERRRLREAVGELVEGSGADVEDGRVEEEIALLADKWDVGEETVRARSHLDGFEELLEAPASEPVGKRMKFLVQELHREINTTGAKANDAEISREVVEMKNEIEKMREQIENVE